ncbi:hypothetical protein CPB84DRAFT_1340609 [Gymnopilus junonius]|uniref:Uncharacterized protein n=1 Tax=Gymnopilus junonius TaxID=109634 RepID=A0A9P5TM55_GYMJU|nr:hypothetical protein CPB84DRAFT_1340609 [Gymnopilus junonius]
MSISSGHGGQMESYGMRELGPSSGGSSGGGVPGPVAGPAPGEIFDPYAMGAAAGVGGAAGAAGIGVARARSMKSSSPEGGQGGYGAALQEGGAPYAAFAAPPQYGGYDPYANPGSGVNSAQRNAEILEAAGMGAHLNGAGVGLNRGPSSGGAYGYQQQPGQQYSQEYNNVSPNLGRNRSLGGMGMAPVQESYDPYANASLSPPQQPLSASSGNSVAIAQSTSSPPQGQVHAPTHQPGLSTVSAGGTDADDMDDAYGGYEAADDHDHDAGNKLPNPFANATSVEGGHGGYGGSRESRYSEDGDEIEEEPPRRVLKVANE